MSKSVKMKNFVACLALAVAVFSLSMNQGEACDQKFEGFGIFLGSNDHFGRSKPGTEAKVMQVLYEFLGIRLFRTSYEQTFSPEPNKYEITCTENDPFTCSWIKLQKIVGSYPDVKVFASIWSPPHYMKNNFYQLVPEEETAYFYFITNVTEIIKQEYNITIEKVSPVNEPENLFAPWDHTNMSPEQLCRIIRNYNHSLISVCPENSYFWVSRAYYNFPSGEPGLNCSAYCDIQATHAYALNLDFSSGNGLLAYYDMKKYNLRGTTGPIWMTEVSSTYRNADQNQMQEALDLANNILNFLGTTCVQRYYFWYAYTLGMSGESLIWGDGDGNLIFPKKFFVYKSFVNASNTINGPVEVNNCDSSSLRNHNIVQRIPTPSIVENLGCIQFGDVDRVIVNTDLGEKSLEAHNCFALCCTTEADDIKCTESSTKIESIPGRSVCHCIMGSPVVLNNSIVLSR